MHVKDIVAEDFINYKLPSMYIITSICNWKCCIERGISIDTCQNSPLSLLPSREVSDKSIWELYHNNGITKAVVVGGLEPFMQFDELDALISLFREYGETCDFVIYTGYTPGEIAGEVYKLSRHKGIIIKYGRYIPDSASVFDPVLGVKLASSNQYAVRIS